MRIYPQASPFGLAQSRFKEPAIRVLPFQVLIVVFASVFVSADRLFADDKRIAMMDVAKKATAFVEIRTDRFRGSGSAFCLDATAGLFVTNAHVAAPEHEKNVKLTIIVDSGQPNQRKLAVSVVKIDVKHDLAIVKVEGGQLLSQLELGETGTLVETDSLTVFGYPLGDALASQRGQYPSISVNIGRVTALRKDAGALRQIQLDATVTHGNSGGPVLDENGKVVGILSSGVTGVAINFAVPVDDLLRLLQSENITLTPTILPPELHRLTTAHSTTQTTNASSQSLRPVPEPSALAAADKLLDGIYSKELADSSQTGRAAFTRRLLDLASRRAGDPVEQLALLQKARNLAIAAADVKTAFEAVNAMCAAFRIDGLSAESEVLSKLYKVAVKPEAQALLAKNGVKLIDRLITNEQYNEASLLVAIVRTAATQSHNGIVRSRVDEHLSYATAICNERERIKASVELLKTRPEDPEANFAAGKFYCAFMGDWDRGLSMLNKGSEKKENGVWVTLAKRDQNDLAGIQTSADEQAAMAGAWWELSGKQTGLVKAQLEARAAFWYRRAMPGLAGLARIQAEQRASSGGSASSSTEPTAAHELSVNLLAAIDLKTDVVMGRFERTENGIAQTDGSQSQILLKHDFPAEYDIRATYVCTKLLNKQYLLYFYLPIGNHFYKCGYKPFPNHYYFGFWDAGKLLETSSMHAYSRAALEFGKPYSILVKVRRDHMEGYIDGEQILTATYSDKLAPAEDSRPIIAVSDTIGELTELSVTDLPGKSGESH